MTAQHCHHGNSSKTFILGKEYVFSFLEDRQLLRDDAIIVFMVSEDLLLLDFEVRPVSPLSQTDVRNIAHMALMKNAAGIILAEFYRHVRPWPSPNIDAKLLQQELLNHGLELIDALVLERNHARSRAFPVQT